MTLQIGFLLFPQLQQLDLTGPYDVLASLPDVKVHLIWKDLVPITASTGLVLKPTITFDDCPPLDVICIPGGSGVGPLMEDDETLAFIKAQAANAKYVTSVCTGALVLGAAGLLKENVPPLTGRITNCSRCWERFRLTIEWCATAIC